MGDIGQFIGVVSSEGPGEDLASGNPADYVFERDDEYSATKTRTSNGVVGFSAF